HRSRHTGHRISMSIHRESPQRLLLFAPNNRRETGVPMHEIRSNRLAEFRAKVADCRAQVDDIVWRADGASGPLTASRLDLLYDAVLDALMIGGEAGFASLAPVGCAMGDVMPSLRSIDGSC